MNEPDIGATEPTMPGLPGRGPDAERGRQVYESIAGEGLQSEEVENVCSMVANTEVAEVTAFELNLKAPEFVPLPTKPQGEKQWKDHSGKIHAPMT